MENKYYTPSIEEFHVGFEYEVNYGNDDWQKESINHKPEVVTLPYMRLDNIRVKYLDRDDIESLGWKKEKDYFIKNNYKLYLYGNSHIQIQSSGNLNFNGTIKNKSELIKLLKQLNITNE